MTALGVLRGLWRALTAVPRWAWLLAMLAVETLVLLRMQRQVEARRREALARRDAAAADRIAHLRESNADHAQLQALGRARDAHAAAVAPALRAEGRIEAAKERIDEAASDDDALAAAVNRRFGGEL